MTGGRRRVEDLERPGCPRWVAPAPTLDEVTTEAALGGYKRAMMFRRLLQRQLRPLGVSFAEWRVLEATSRLSCRSGDPVSYLDVARELQLGEGSVSRLMWQLTGRGLVDPGLDGLCQCFRVLLTAKSERVVELAYEVATRVAARVWPTAGSVGAFELLAGGFPAQDAAFEVRDG